MKPWPCFKDWLDAACKTGLHEPTAMTLATANAQGRPSARTMLLKSFDERGFVFFANSQSRKGDDLRENDYVCRVMLLLAAVDAPGTDRGQDSHHQCGRIRCLLGDRDRETLSWAHGHRSSPARWMSGKPSRRDWLKHMPDFSMIRSRARRTGSVTV